MSNNRHPMYYIATGIGIAIILLTTMYLFRQLPGAQFWKLSAAMLFLMLCAGTARLFQWTRRIGAATVLSAPAGKQTGTRL